MHLCARSLRRDRKWAFGAIAAEWFKVVFAVRAGSVSTAVAICAVLPPRPRGADTGAVPRAGAGGKNQTGLMCPEGTGRPAGKGGEGAVERVNRVTAGRFLPVRALLPITSLSRQGGGIDPPEGKVAQR